MFFLTFKNQVFIKQYVLYYLLEANIIILLVFNAIFGICSKQVQKLKLKMPCYVLILYYIVYLISILYISKLVEFNSANCRINVEVVHWA